MLQQEVRQSLRFIVRNPGFSAVAVLSLALGIGANAAVFSLADVMLFRPLPVNDPGRVVITSSSLSHHLPSSICYLPFAQNRSPRMILLAESDGDPATLTEPLRTLVHSLDVDQPVFNVQSFSSFYEKVGVARLLAAGLTGLGPPSPVTFVVAPAAVLFAAMVACYVPARRASLVDPIVALRYE